MVRSDRLMPASRRLAERSTISSTVFLYLSMPVLDLL